MPLIVADLNVARWFDGIEFCELSFRLLVEGDGAADNS